MTAFSFAMSALERQLAAFRREQFQSLTTKPAEEKRAKEERRARRAADAAAQAAATAAYLHPDGAVPAAPAAARARKKTSGVAEEPGGGARPSPDASLPLFFSQAQPAARTGPPVMFLVKKALDCLQAAGGAPLAPAELLARCGVDVAADAELATLLAANPKVRTTAGGGGGWATYAYASTFSLSGRPGLAALLAGRPEGTPLRELADSYPGCGDDVAALAAEGKAWVVENSESRDRVAYPRDAAYEVAVDPAVKRVWARMQLPPAPEELARELARAGIPPSVAGGSSAAAAAARRAAAEAAAGRGGGGAGGDKKRKRKREFSKLHVTNAHLWDELFAPGAAAQFGDDDD